MTKLERKELVNLIERCLMRQARSAFLDDELHHVTARMIVQIVERFLRAHP